MWSWQGRPPIIWTRDDIRIFIWCSTDIVSGPMKTPCWVWNLLTDCHGYGRMKMGREPYMHRNSYTAFKGQIPDGKVIMHLCNNKSCVNPKHLEVGDHVENIKAAYAAGLHKIYKGSPVYFVRRI